MNVVESYVLLVKTSTLTLERIGPPATPGSVFFDFYVID
jgi:hypothetical protein